MCLSRRSVERFICVVVHHALQAQWRETGRFIYGLPLHSGKSRSNHCQLIQCREESLISGWQSSIHHIVVYVEKSLFLARTASVKGCEMTVQNTTIQIRLTKDEKSRILDRMREDGYHNVSRWVRGRLLGSSLWMDQRIEEIHKCVLRVEEKVG